MAMLKIMGTVHNFISNEVRSSVISLVSSLSSVFLIGLQINNWKILEHKKPFLFTDIMYFHWNYLYNLYIINSKMDA